MNGPTSAPGGDPSQQPPTQEEMLTELFSHMIVQQANMALMLMGKIPNPETGEAIQDLESARFFVEQLEMIRIKTKGNLTPQEEELLGKGLGMTRMAFMEAVQATNRSPIVTPPRPAGGPPIIDGSSSAPELGGQSLSAPPIQAEVPTPPVAEASPAPIPAQAPTPAALPKEPPQEESRTKFSKKY